MTNKDKKVFPDIDKETKEILENYESQIRQTLVKIIDSINLLKDGKQVVTFNKLNGLVQKLNLFHSHIQQWIKDFSEKNSN